MKVEREIAGFSLPFAAGVFMSILAGSHLQSTHHTDVSVSLAAASLLLAVLMHPSRRRLAPALLIMLVAALFFCTGCFCGTCGKILSVSASEGRFMMWARSWGSMMQMQADSIPFSSPQTNAIIKALLTGERCDIPPEVTAIFRDSGASHILALSGFHLGIIYGLVKHLTSVMGNRRNTLIIRSMITTAACGIYTMATGAGPSIVRAFLFILIGETATMTHRYRSTGSVLLAALFIQLAVSPTSASSAGFQLSYAAMAGIAFIFPWLRSLWPGNPHTDGRFAGCVRWIWNSAAMSVSCQLTTAPLAWMYFHSFPQHFLMTNMTALPLAGVVIPISLITMGLHAAGLCPDLLIRFTEMLVRTMTDTLEIIASM